MANLIDEYKDKLGDKISVWSFPHGKETYAINIYENGFVIRKRKQVIVLDVWSLCNLKDLIDKFIEKKKVLKSIEEK